MQNLSIDVHVIPKPLQRYDLARRKTNKQRLLDHYIKTAIRSRCQLPEPMNPISY